MPEPGRWYPARKGPRQTAWPKIGYGVLAGLLIFAGLAAIDPGIAVCALVYSAVPITFVWSLRNRRRSEADIEAFAEMENPDALPAAFIAYRWRGTTTEVLSVDTGVLLFEPRAISFAGFACSFRLGRQDVEEASATGALRLRDPKQGVEVRFLAVGYAKKKPERMEQIRLRLRIFLAGSEPEPGPRTYPPLENPVAARLADQGPRHA